MEENILRINPKPFIEGREIELDKNGWPVSITDRRKMTPNEIIEEFGEFFTEEQINIIRNHEKRTQRNY